MIFDISLHFLAKLMEFYLEYVAGGLVVFSETSFKVEHDFSKIVSVCSISVMNVLR